MYGQGNVPVVPCPLERRQQPRITKGCYVRDALSAFGRLSSRLTADELPVAPTDRQSAQRAFDQLAIDRQPTVRHNVLKARTFSSRNRNGSDWRSARRSPSDISRARTHQFDVQENHQRVTAMTRYLAILVVTFLGAGCAIAADESPFKITTKRNDDKIVATVESDKAVISVRSPVGISQAVIERNSEQWPDTVILRLHLKGLEGLKISNGKITLEAAVSSQDRTVRLWENDKEDSPLDSLSQYWTEIRLIGKDGKPTKGVPSDDGYFEMQLPGALLEGNPKSITINWIDCYR